MVRRILFFVGFTVCCMAAWSTRADTFNLTDGRSLTGELLPSSANDINVKIKVSEGQYEQVSWALFSQDDLKKLMANPKLAPFVEPFIEVPREAHLQKTQVQLKIPPPLDNRSAPAPSIFGAMASSGLGLFILLLIYAGNLYAAYEVAVFRALSPGLVCGVSAAAPFIGPAIFLCMRTKVAPTQTWETAPEPVAEGKPIAESGTAAQTGGEALNPMQAEGVAHPSGLKLAPSEPHESKPALPETVTFQRGQFTFNRRFFETKFPGFFGVVRRDADRDMVLVITAARGRYVGQRIARIAANDLHLEVHQGAASEEVLIPFGEIKQIQLKHKDAP